MRRPRELGQPQQCACVSFRQIHSADVHEDKILGERCQEFGKTILIFRIPLPNQIGQQLSCYQTFIQLVLESFGKLETHRISF